MRNNRLLEVCLLTAAMGTCTFADVIIDRPADGVLVERVPLGPARWRVTVWLTDGDKNVIDAFDWPMIELTANGRPVKFKIPKQVQKAGTGVPGTPPAFADVKDVKQRIEKLGSDLEASDLEIESLMFDPETGEYFLNPIFGTLLRKVGANVSVSIPDLFADTSGDGILGEGDILYSLVDLNVYLDSIPSFSLGDGFLLTSGMSAALPGMLFSTTPFTFDPGTGFGGTPYSGEAVAQTAHDILATPEPGGFVLAATGVLALLLRRRIARHTSG